MKAKFAEFVDYFEQLAREHVDILHTDQEKHFFRIELEEILTGLRSRIRYPALILEGYDFVFKDQNSDNVHKEVSCAFTVLDHVKDKGDFDQIHLVWQQMEEIGDEICIRILDDKRSRSVDVLSHFHLTNVRGALLVDTSLLHYGVRYEFVVSWPVENDIDPEKWNQLPPNNSTSGSASG
jgi:hypothetical protein